MNEGMSGRLAGKIAVVTGGASGIGEGIVRRFCQEGAEVLLADIDVAMGNEVASSCGATFIRLDVGKESAWQHLESTVRSNYRQLDVMVNNAGVVSCVGYYSGFGSRLGSPDEYQSQRHDVGLSNRDLADARPPGWRVGINNQYGVIYLLFGDSRCRLYDFQGGGSGPYQVGRGALRQRGVQYSLQLNPSGSDAHCYSENRY